MTRFSVRPRARAPLAAGALVLITAVAAGRAGAQGPGALAAVRVASDQAAVARARADSARLPWTAADAQFMSAMIGHHGQAVTMSRLAPGRGASASVQTLAARIINAQRDEIAIMQQWLRDRRQPAPPGPDAAPNAGGAHAGHDMASHDMAAYGTTASGTPGPSADAHAGMPGMLTAAQLAELGAARGREFDRLFLTYMIQHHRGAVSMVRDLFATPGAGQDEVVFKFASDVNVDQTTEIARMQRMLADVVFADP